LEQEVILSVQHLNVKFSLRGKILHAIRDVSLDLYKGETLAIVGESGSGKSVLTKSFMGLLDQNGWIESGSILYKGQDLARFQTEKEWLPIRGGEIAMVLQDPMTSLNPLKTIGAQIREAAALHGNMSKREATARAAETLKEAGITPPEPLFKARENELSWEMRKWTHRRTALSSMAGLLARQQGLSDAEARNRAQQLLEEKGAAGPGWSLSQRIAWSRALSSVSKTLMLYQGMSKKAAKKRAVEILSDVGITEPERRSRQYPHEFSGGMRQRVVIAIAIACNPKILICDEPTTALDVTIQAQILHLIRDLVRKYELTCVYITHDLGVVANVADRVAVMYAGDIVEIGLAREVFYDARHPYTWALLSSLPQLGVKGEKLFSIRGTPPNLFLSVKGDAFAPRNPHALKIDYEERPPMFQASPTHFARTWLMHPDAPKVQPPEVLKRLKQEVKA